MPRRSGGWWHPLRGEEPQFLIPYNRTQVLFCQEGANPRFGTPVQPLRLSGPCGGLFCRCSGTMLCAPGESLESWNEAVRARGLARNLLHSGINRILSS